MIGSLLSRAACLLTIISLSNVAFSQSIDHMSIALSNDGIRSLLSSTIDLMDGTEDDIVSLGDGVIEENFELDPVKFGTVLNFLQPLLSVDISNGIPLFAVYKDTKIIGNVSRENLTVKMKKISDTEYNFVVRSLVRNLEIDVPYLSFCTTSDCVRGAYIKFKGIHLRQSENSIPIVLQPTFNVKFENNKINLKLISVYTNLRDQRPPSIELTYSTSKDKNGQWPKIVPNQLGPRRADISIDREDLVALLDKHEEDLAREIVKECSGFLSNEFLGVINDLLSDNKIAVVDAKIAGKYEQKIYRFNDEVKKEELKPNSIYRQEEVRVDNTYYHVDKPILPDIIYGSFFDKLFESVSYEVALDRLTFEDRIFSLILEPTLYLNNKKTVPSKYMGYGRDLQPISKIDVDRSLMSNDSNVAIAISEPYLNSVLKTSKNIGTIDKMIVDLLKRSGITSSSHGIKTHFKNGKLYLILNILVDLTKQDGWVDRVVGGAIERRWGDTNGKIFFPLEIPLDLQIANRSDGSKYLEVTALSPFDTNGELVNEFAYPSNLDDTAKTWLLNMKKTVLASIYENMYQLLSDEIIDGRQRLKIDPINLTEMLESLPIHLTPNEIKIEESGHLFIYGKLKGIDFKELSQKGSVL